MKVRALVGFTGIVSMYIGEEREINGTIADDLIKAGYVAEVKKTDGRRDKKKEGEGV